MVPAKLIAIVLTLLISAATVVVNAQTGLDIRERVKADYSALRSAEQDYRLQKSRGRLSSREAADYQIYLDTLRDRFHSACSLLTLEAGLALAAEVPCPSKTPAMPFAPAIDLQAERTEGEQTADLDVELGQALGEFDEMLLREQQRIKAATPASVAALEGENGQGHGGAQDSAAQTIGQGRESAGAVPTAQQGEAGERDLPLGGTGTTVSSTGAVGGLQQDGRHPVGGRPRDIPDGSDDDVVARQLREAAEKETDPELKAKLWEEYRRYKRGRQ